MSNEYPDDAAVPRVPAGLWFVPCSFVLLLLECTRHGAQAFMLFLLLSAFPLSAACRFREITGRNPFSLGLERGINHFLNLFFFLFVLLLFVAPGFIYMLMRYRADPDISDATLERLFYLTVVPSVFIPLIRLWPVFTISFTALTSEGSFTRRGWYGPGLIAAWRQTGQREVFLTATVPFLLMTAAVIAVPAVAGAFASKGVFFFVRLVSYFVLIPGWAAVAIGLGNRVHEQWRARSHE